MESTKTFGDRLVELNIDSLNNESVLKANKLFAELINIVESTRESASSRDYVKNQLYSHTIGEILNAQSNVIRYITTEITSPYNHI
jgi:hypothetical protein